MKGVILAGGNGTRLRPCTEVTNKHLLPVYDWPMIFYPINTLKGAGIDDICIVVGGNSVGDVINLCGDGSRFGVRLTYKHQKQAGGIAEALLLTKDFVGEDTVAVILGDNIFLSTVELKYLTPPCLFVTPSRKPQEFGCAELDMSKKIVTNIVEKPEKPATGFIVTGLYLYSGKGLFDNILNLHYSDRHELEITDLNNLLRKDNFLAYEMIPENTWYDAGSVDNILKASKFAKKFKNSGSYKDHITPVKYELNPTITQSTSWIAKGNPYQSTWTE